MQTINELIRLPCLSPSGFHHMAVQIMGNLESQRPPIVCVHGLTRNRHDFSKLAQALSRTHKLVLVDVVGRGDSDWLHNPAHYTYPQYVQDMVGLLAFLNAPSLDWVGTSMGGLIGMMLAVQAGSPIRRLVLNDIGPFIPLSALQNIALYVGQEPVFESIQAAEMRMRSQNSGFAPMRDEDWQEMAETSVRPCAESGFRMHYDPKIREIFASVTADINLWPLYEALPQPVLLLRGEHSDVLSEENAKAMTERGPKAELKTIKNAGHAPALRDAEQLGFIAEFLARA